MCGNVPAIKRTNTPICSIAGRCRRHSVLLPPRLPAQALRRQATDLWSRASHTRLRFLGICTPRTIRHSSCSPVSTIILRCVLVSERINSQLLLASAGAAVPGHSCPSRGHFLRGTRVVRSPGHCEWRWREHSRVSVCASTFPSPARGATAWDVRVCREVSKRSRHDGAIHTCQFSRREGASRAVLICTSLMTYVLICIGADKHLCGEVPAIFFAELSVCFRFPGVFYQARDLQIYPLSSPCRLQRQMLLTLAKPSS